MFAIENNKRMWDEMGIVPNYKLVRDGCSSC
jgi:hypothetical protein